MRKLIVFILICATVKNVNAQTISQKIATAYKQFENDSQLRHAISSLYVIDAATGKVVYDKNSQIGLAPASSQKIITAATAFELLGKDYRYKTEFGYDGEINVDTLEGNIYLMGSGDPTLGSGRFNHTNAELILKQFCNTLLSRKIKALKGSFYIQNKKFSTQTIPDGWIWQDIGNYYGAGVSPVNWRENQYDIFLKSGKTQGSPVNIVKSNRLPSGRTSLGILYNELVSARAGSGDNAYRYFSPGSNSSYLRGTIPVDKDSFQISVALYSPEWLLYDELNMLLLKNSIELIGKHTRQFEEFEDLQHYFGNQEFKVHRFGLDSLALEDISKYNPFEKQFIKLYTHYSPSLDSIIYWLLKKSINLYGEALLKTMAFEKKGFGATDTGVNVVKDFWKQNGIDPDELNIYDGSGLSPMNRVTTHAQVEILKYARKQSWFRYFYEALPEYNGMKLKSGTIGDVKAFCGYHTSKDGKNYIISFIVNNYSGSSSTLVNKMYHVLDVLK